ncbi:hypothetical protein MUN89_19160 [Halobacillus salinarum]|uniref:Uncharacterized protein n=1 Tax=Halobacillus salinarum TaxID=2932257 RepID=A0ABY4EIT8_9BACI|nr:hypothetical protein [Halobacillus salinarum]UOQ43962.1 hypothetical protein MUN89_19160 [Halobacillus salinarum]
MKVSRVIECGKRKRKVASQRTAWTALLPFTRRGKCAATGVVDHRLTEYEEDCPLSGKGELGEGESFSVFKECQGARSLPLLRKNE